MSSSPFISIDPAMRSGAPCINGIRVPVDSICEVVWQDGVAAAMEEGWELTRGDVLVACWYAGAYGVTRIRQREDTSSYLHYGKVWRNRWGTWAASVHLGLWNTSIVDYDAIPDPPGSSDDA